MTLSRPDYTTLLANLREKAGIVEGEPISPRLYDGEAGHELRHVEARLQGWIPPRYTDAEPTHPDVLGWAEHIADGGTDGLMLFGPTGVGKTWQLMGALRHLAHRGWRGTVVSDSWPALLAKARGELRDTAVERDQRLETRMRRCGLLLVDDLGADRPTEWAAELLYLTVDERWQNVLPIAVASNLPPAQLREQIGDRLTSRLAGMCRQVTLTGEDLRRRR